MSDYKVTIKVDPTILTGGVGHAFLTLSATGKPDITIGYYPIQEGAGAVPTLGTVRNDMLTHVDPDKGLLIEHPYLSSKTFLITEQQYANMLQKAAQIANDPSDYYNALTGVLTLPLSVVLPHSLTGSNVCTDFVRTVLTAGDIEPTFGEFGANLLPQSLMTQYFLKGYDQRSAAGLLPLPGAYANSIDSATNNLWTGVKAYDPTYTKGLINGTTDQPAPGYSIATPMPESDQLAALTAQRERNLAAGLAPDGSPLGNWAGDATKQGQVIWVREQGSGQYVQFVRQVRESGAASTWEVRYDSNGNFVAAKTFETSATGITTEYYLPTNSAVPQVRTPSRDADYTGGNYTVQSGDTLWDIAQDSGLTLQELLDANPQITHPNLIHSGQVINRPAVAPTTNHFDLNVTPDPAATQTTPRDPVTSISFDHSTLVDHGTYTIGGLFDVNTITGNYAYANNLLSDGYRPGNQNLATEIISSQLAKNFRANPNLIDSVVWNPDVKAAAMNYLGTGVEHAIPTDPLILDLDGDGVKLTSFGEAPVLFDIDHDGGSKEITGWVSKEDGIVVMDLNGNGKIDGIHETLSEYFNGTAGVNGEAGEKKYAHGFAALKSLDSNADNAFTSADAAWNSVKAWQDADHDGQTDAGELKTLTELNITRIDLAPTTQSGLVNGGNEVLATGSFVINGQTREAQATRFIAEATGNTSVASGNGSTVTAQDGQSTYVSSTAAGETIDVAAKGVKNAYGSSGDDVLTGDTNANWLAGSLGSDTFIGGAGDDMLIIDADDLQANIHAGDGFDMLQVVGSTGVTLNLTQAEVEIAVGGTGNDVLVGGGRSSVFIRADDGDDIVIGGAANDALSGENGDDLIDGAAGNDVMRGGRGQDQIMGGAGDDVIEGGQDDDRLEGGTGNDVLKGQQGDDTLDGGEGTDVAEYTGALADYRITHLTDDTWRVVDTRTGRDGADMLSGIEKLSFADVSGVEITLDNPFPVKDVLTIANRIGTQLIKVADLLVNDRDWQGDALHITQFSDIKGGSIVGSYDAATGEWVPTLTANGELQFTPDPAYTGVMSFKYKIADVDGTPGATAIQIGTENAAEMRGQVFIKTADMPTDTLFTDQWYLNDINILPVWRDAYGQGYTGKDVKIAQFEPGGPYSVGSEVFDYRHPDLQANVDQDWLADPNNAIPQSFSNHATLVAGVMVAARDGQGAVGVAYDAKLSGHYIQGEGLEVSALEQEITNALAQFKNYDVVNNSWGATANFDINVVPVGTVQRGILDAVNLGRDGLGTVIVMAGGNDRQTGGNTNTNALTANRAVIVTGAINVVGDISTLSVGQAPFSNPGASILVSAPGSNVTSTGRILMNDDGTVFGSDAEITQGTSFATPIVSGVVALMLEANPNLGWRNMQQILAITAKKVNDPNTDTVWNGAANWNGGGMHTSHDYGFGEVDARAAVRLAETWVGAHASYNERHLANGEGSINGAGNLNIAIGDGSTVTRTLSIGAGLRVEHATVSLDVNHSNWGDLTVELISPTGTVSKLIANPGTYAGNPGGDAGDGRLEFALDTTHSYGESAQGNWLLRITDRSGRGTGTLNGWKVDVYGSDFNETFDGRDAVAGETPVISATADNSYFFTDEFAGAPGASRSTLADSNGGKDTINAAAVSTGSTINLNNGATSTIAGRSLMISGDVEFAFGGDGNDTLTGNALSNRLQGGRGNDALSGGAQLDYLDGGKGNDTLTGGADRDIYIIRPDANAVDTITDFSIATAGEKIILVGFQGLEDYSQVSKVQEGAHVRLNLGSDQSVLVHNVSLSQLTEQCVMVMPDEATLSSFLPYMGNVWAAGDANAQSLLLPTNSGDIAYYAQGGNDVVGADTRNDLLDGGDGGDVLYGEYNLTATTGDDWLEGGAGNDAIFGGGGNDLLVGGSGHDDLYGEDGDDLLNGNSGDDYLFAGTGDDVLDGGSGRDLLSGEAGNDTLYVEDDLGRINLITNIMDYGMLGGTGSDTFVLQAGAAGFSGIINGSDSLVDAGNLIGDFSLSEDKIDLCNIQTVSRFSDLVISQSLSYNGRVMTRVTVGSAANAPVLQLYGVTPAQLNASHFIFASVAGAGTAGNDVLTGDAGADRIDGGLGADRMEGRTGDDTYVVDNGGDMTVELPDGGFDTVMSSISHTLSANVENLALTGSSAINGTGNELVNRITGNGADNVLDGGSGVDTLVGGAGNDTYVADNQSDTVVEVAGEGTDTVWSSVSYTLGDNIENLVLTGSITINATGNGLSNALTGNIGDNFLDGGTGADTMAGGAGNDTYLIDNIGDTVTENASEGIDTVYATINVTLAANVENLVLAQGSTSGTGNDLDNWLAGNAAANTLDGGAGADTMVGGLGDDTYVVDNASDVVVENASEGTDIVQSSITFSLGANQENLTLAGTVNIDGNGNSLDNILRGNGGDNLLSGGAGNDTLFSGGGGDVLNGDAGDDTFYINDYQSSNGCVSYTTGGDGMDTYVIVNTGNQYGELNFISSDVQDTLIFNGFSLADVQITRDYVDWYDYSYNWCGEGSSDLAIHYLGGSAIIRDYFSDGHTSKIDRVIFDDATLDFSALKTMVTGTATSGADKLYGFAWASDTIDGGLGNDTIFGAGDEYDQTYGYGGFDILYGGEGNDYLTAGRGVLDGGAGDDLLYLSIGNPGTGNHLIGGAGNDVISANSWSGRLMLEGGRGADTLRALSGGQNTVQFNLGDGQDTTLFQDDNRDDVLNFTGISSDQLWFSKSGHNLVISVIGTTDKVTISNWDSGVRYHAAQIQAGSMTLLESNVQALVDAMAAFAPPPPGQTTLPSNYQNALAPALAANWQ